jgi:hypothetical protein
LETFSGSFAFQRRCPVISQVICRLSSVTYAHLNSHGFEVLSKVVINDAAANAYASVANVGEMVAVLESRLGLLENGETHNEYLSHFDEHSSKEEYQVETKMIPSAHQIMTSSMQVGNKKQAWL